MSYGLAAWFSQHRFSDDGVMAQYYELRSGNTNSLKLHPAITAFCDELSAFHPEIDDIPEDKHSDFSPGSIAHDFPDCHIILCCVRPHANYVHDPILQLAKKHGLAGSDPQLTKIYYPND